MSRPPTLNCYEIRQTRGLLTAVMSAMTSTAYKNSAAAKMESVEA